MRRFLAIASLLIFLGCKEGNTVSQPNILLIVTDDQGYGDQGYTGNTVLETPELDELSSNSIIFDRFYVSPVCAPTRASLLTGKYHLSAGVSWVTHRKEVMRQEETTIAEYLKTKGYTSGLFGKWHNGNQYPHDPIGQGFDTFIGFKEGHFNNYFNPKLTNRFNKEEFNGYLPDVITEEAIKFMSATSKPFFGMVAYNTPHSPFQVPDSYFDKYKDKGLEDRLACIYGMIENIDDNIGRLVDHLDASELRENTIIIFVGDNGPNGSRYNGGLKGIKSHVDEGGVRVPALISYPAKGWNTGKTVNQLAAHIDILPTIAGLFGEEVGTLDGVNLEGHINGERIERSFFTHQVVRKFGRYPGAVRQGDFLLTIKNGENALYNLGNDMEQKENLADSLHELASEMRLKYEKWVDQSIQDLGETELVETGHEEIKKIQFQAQEVLQSDNVDFKGMEGWANDYLINFSDSSLIQWQTKTIAKANYTISLEMNADVGTELLLQVDSTNISLIIDKPLVKQLIPSSDRVARGEVYEYDWKEKVIGNVTLSKGIHTISIRTLNAQNLQIKSLQLIKTDEQAIGTSEEAS